MFSISEVAQQFSISKNTLRYYESEGLLGEITRDKNGVRCYTTTDIEVIKRIVFLRRLGASIKEIKKFSLINNLPIINEDELSQTDLQERLAFLSDLDQKLDQQIKEIQQQKVQLAKKTTRITALLHQKSLTEDQE